MSLRVLVVDDHPLVRRGTCDILAGDPEIDVVGQAADGIEALAAARRLSPDVVVLDISMPGMDGVEVTRRLGESGEPGKVLVLSAGGEDEQILAALQAGALGYLLKTAPEDLILEAVRRVAAGQSALLQPEVTRTLVAGAGRPPPGRSPAPLVEEWVEPLSDREVEVLREVARDQANKEVARRLGISDRTVQQHLANIFAKLGAASRTGAVLKALHLGILTLEDCKP